jgi:plastocyanin
MNDWWKVGAAGIVAAVFMPGLVFAAAQQTIVQSGREFHPAEITINAGDTLLFTNRDEFIHQIYIPAMNFDSDEKAPGETLTVPFPTAGTFEVRCHIHPKMRLVVHVK